MRTQQTFSEEFEEIYNYYNDTEKGKELLKLEGISREYLDVGAMSKAYFTEHVPDITSDANANCNEGICQNNYSSEIVKGISKLDGYYLFYHYARKRFGDERAKELIKSAIRGDVYIHDSTKPQIPYSYFGDTSLLVKINGMPYLMTMRDLFNKFCNSSYHVMDADVIDMDVSQKIITDIAVRHGKTASYNPLEMLIANEKNIVEIWNGKTWTSVKRILKHPNRTKLLCIGTDSGKVTTVTDNHPVILANGDLIDANKIKHGDLLMECNQPLPYTPRMDVNMDLAYLMGIFAGDGHINNYGLSFTQDDNTILSNVKKSLDNINITYKEYPHDSKTNIKRLRVNGTNFCSMLISNFNIDGKSYTKRMPINIIQWDKESIAAYLSGLFDAEGTINLNLLYFRTVNMALAQQFAEMMKILGTDLCRVHVNTYNSKSGFKPSSNVIYVVSFRPTDDALQLMKKTSKKLENYEVPPRNDKCCKTILNAVDKIIQIDSALDIFDDVYDITVDGDVFYSQGLIQHNCFSFSTSIIMNEGRRYGQLQSLPPKRSDSFIAQVTESCMDLSQELSGAIAPSDMLINFAWYSNKENLSDKEIVNRLQSFCHVMNNKFRVSAESPFSNVSLFDKYTLENITKSIMYPDGSKPDLDYIMHVQKIFGEWFAKGDPVSGFPYRFPILTVNLMKDENGNILDQDFLNWVSINNIKTGCMNIYVNDGFKIASCCRMINSANKMRQYKGDSFGNGGLSLGSHRVVTLNLPRIAIKSGGDKTKFKKLLSRDLETCRDLLQVHREEILKRRVDLGFLKFINPLKWFTLDHMFSTIGVIGIYEMCYFMNEDIQNESGVQFVIDVLSSIEEFADKTSVETNHSWNVEEIPAESVAIKLCQKDKVMFGSDKIPFELYSNQYIPLIVEASIPERIETTGKFMDILSGGGILHLNIKEQITDPSVMRHLIEQCVKKNVSHFAINYGLGSCENGHTTVCGNSKKCQICNGNMVSWMTRVIGYFSIVNNWSKVRREYEFPRRVFS